MLVSVRLGQIRLGYVRFFFLVNCPTAKNPRAITDVFQGRTRLDMPLCLMGA